VFESGKKTRPLRTRARGARRGCMDVRRLIPEDSEIVRMASKVSLVILILKVIIFDVKDLWTLIFRVVNGSGLS
jgi:hypothetical protein